jgi:hypothetical protein
VGMVVLNTEEWDAMIFGPFGGEVFGMEIMDDKFGFNFKNLLDMIDGHLKKLKSLQIFEITNMLTQKNFFILG